MSKTIIIITGILYAGVCIEQLWKGNYGMAIAYFGYAVSNIGLAVLAS